MHYLDGPDDGNIITHTCAGAIVAYYFWSTVLLLSGRMAPEGCGLSCRVACRVTERLAEGQSGVVTGRRGAVVENCHD